MSFTRAAFSLMLVGSVDPALAQSTKPVVFSTPITLTAGAGPIQVAAGDLNHDGKPDLVVITDNPFVGSGTGPGIGNLYVFLGNGDGSFQAGQLLLSSASAGVFPTKVLIGDFNGDGKPDLAVAGSVPSPGGGFDSVPTLSIFLGKGDGTFQTPTTTNLPLVGTLPAVVQAQGSALASGDFNGDGKLDLAVTIAGSTIPSTVVIMLGQGNGTFSAGPSYAVGKAPLDVQVGDLNGDGKLDLVVDNNNDASISVFLGNGNGTFTPLTVFHLDNGPSNNAVGDPDAIALADFNKDGHLDLLVGVAFGHVELFLGNGDGTFKPPLTYSPGDSGLCVADFNGDGVPDFAVAGGAFSTSAVFLGNGDGTFVVGTTLLSGSSTAGTFPYAVACADFNGDGKPDFAMTDLGYPQGSSNRVLVYLNASTGFPLSIITSSLPSGTQGIAYSQSLVASGGTPPYAWSLASGSLPTGLTLSSNGTITGTPTAIGSSTFSVRVSDGASANATQTFTLSITNGTLTITTVSPLLPAVSGSAFSQALMATGGTAPYSWSLIAGSLPSGLTLSTAGAITGTPTVAGLYSFTIKVTDSASSSATQAFNLAVIAATTLVRSGVLSHIAAGGGWITVITLVNTSSAAVQVTVALHNDDGSALSLALTTTQQGVSQTTTVSSVTTTINPNATLQISMGNGVTSTVVGWADVLSTSSLGGYAIFRQTPLTGSPSEGTVPLQSQFPSTITLPYDNTAGFVMGVALANLSTSSGNVTATIYDSSGNHLGTQTITIAGSGHTSFVLPTTLTPTAGQLGIVQFQSTASGGIAGIGLRFSPFGTFTSVPTM